MPRREANRTGETASRATIMKQSSFCKYLSAPALAIVVVCTNAAPPEVDTNSTDRPGGFQFDGKISRQVLENYLSRSVSMEGLLNGRGDFRDNIRMLKGEGAKYIGRALCLWGAERDFTNSVERARKEIPLV